MKIQLLSDLHLEFQADDFRRFVGMLDPEGIDVLVLAGDICVDSQIIDVMHAICERYERSDVIWVHGNHEFYGSNRSSVILKSQEAVRQNKNLHWLDCSSVVIGGQRFVGAPLWFVDSEENARLESFMNDFYVIDGFKKWVYLENLRAINYVEGTVDENDIVVTHHLPSNMSVAPRFAKGDLNRFFVCDMEQFIRRRGPKLWVHGHTHDTFDYNIDHGGNTRTVTRVVCNPRGYWPNDLNPDFDPGMVLEL